MKFFVTIGFILMLLFVGCATTTRRSASAGQIGCPEDEVIISNERSGWTTVTWTAECRGQRFICSSVATSSNVADLSNIKNQINCKKESKKK